MAEFIINRSKSVIVVKACGLPTLRLFPGYNKVPADAKKYFTSPAAIGQLKENLDVVESIPGDRKDEAEASFAKNIELNKAQRIVHRAPPADTPSDEILSLRKKIASLEKKLGKGE